MSRSVPDTTLARYHLRHVVRQPGCPLCMLERRPGDQPNATGAARQATGRDGRRP